MVLFMPLLITEHQLAIKNHAVGWCYDAIALFSVSKKKSLSSIFIAVIIPHCL